MRLFKSHLLALVGCSLLLCAGRAQGQSSCSYAWWSLVSEQPNGFPSCSGVDAGQAFQINWTYHFEVDWSNGTFFSQLPLWTVQGSGYCGGLFWGYNYCANPQNHLTLPYVIWNENFLGPSYGNLWQFSATIYSENSGGIANVPNGQGCSGMAITNTQPQYLGTPPCNQLSCNGGPPGSQGNNCNPNNGTPILIDLTGGGWRMTDPAHGVAFRYRDDDAPLQMGWTDPAYANDAWLVRPNKDGSVTSFASNMFGNLTAQPPSSEPNGYAALAYAARQLACNIGEGLDAQNCPALWRQLRVWVDLNQDGVAQPAELRTLDAAGVRWISLKWRKSYFTDQYGNRFGLESAINDSTPDHRCYDVTPVTRCISPTAP